MREEYHNQSKVEGCIAGSVLFLLLSIILSLAGIANIENSHLITLSIPISITSVLFALYGLIIKIPAK